jgi:hypothetical protein
MLLSQLGVESLLVSALPSTSVLPKAHVLNQRCMEVFTDLGVAEEIYARGTPPENMRHTAYYAGLAGPDPVYGRQIGRFECWGAGGLDPDWTSASPCLQANLPQIRLEPIRKARAEALAPGRVRFHQELVDLAQDRDGVTAAPAQLLDDLRSFYFDTALSGSPAALSSLLAFAKPGRVLFGSDSPFAPPPAVAHFTGQLDAHVALDAPGHAAIDRANAAALFPKR